MNTKLQAVIEKIKRLRSLANSTNTMHEATTAAALAASLLDQYRLSEADIETTNDATLDPMMEDDHYIYTSGRITQWKVSLIGILVKHYGLAWFNDNTRETGRKVSRYKLIGKKSDLEIVNYMYAWLLMECQRLSDQEAKGKGHIFVASYCAGFVDGIKIQLEKSRAESKNQASSQAMVRLDAREDEARAFMYKLHNNLCKSKSFSSAHLDRNAFASGSERGASIHLGQALGGSGNKVKLLGN
jgi:hypothetical protein